MSQNVLAVDPGAAHVGVALIREGGINAIEYPAKHWLVAFEEIVDQFDVVVIEKFVLYPHKAAAQSWQAMTTSELIGAMRWIASKAGVEVVMQGADIKIPTRRQCQARNIEWKNKSKHASDALLHLHFYLMHNKRETV